MRARFKGAKQSQMSGSAHLLARALGDARDRRLLAAALQRAAPFAVAAVEQQQRRTVGTAHDVTQVVDLRLVERRFDAGAEVLVDEQAREAHGVWPIIAA